MISRLDCEAVVKKLSNTSIISLDTETSGLRVWDKDFFFSVIIADSEQEYYFNFQPYPGLDPEFILTKHELPLIQDIFNNKEQTIYMANAKFDLAALYRRGIEIHGVVKDVLMGARLLCNDHLSYSLDECAKREGLVKSDAVEKFISENHLWEWEEIPGKKLRSKRMFFNRVPVSIMEEYGCKDARITYDLGIKYDAQILEVSEKMPSGIPTLSQVWANEINLTKVCFEMERVGIKIDRSYCEKAYLFEKGNCERAKRRFKSICGIDFVDSNKALTEAFKSVGIAPGKTEKGNPSFTDAILENVNHDLAQAVRDYREAYKKATTYFQSFLYFSDSESVVHPNIRQAGTTTGRFSCSEPNCQNLSKEEGAQNYKVRDAFIPREDFCFVEFDYKAFEYRMMAEYAGELELIEKIKAGQDVHQATGEMMGVSRKTAKTLNFMLLYGGGAQKLADALELSLEEAKLLKQKYFAALPKVRQFIHAVTNTAERRGFIFNWLGRRYNFSDRSFCYKAPNALIQGGTADIVKVAMNRIAKVLKPCQSRMILQVHDSLLFEIHKTELALLPVIKDILETSYPHKYLQMEVSQSYSWESWGKLKEGTPEAP